MKRILVLLCAAALLLSLCACSGGVKLDGKALAADLSSKVKFNDTLYELDSSMLKDLYNLPDGVTGAAYAGSGATAEEVAVFDAGNAKAAAELLSISQKRLEERAESYSSYMPDEVYKIEHAIIEQQGQYIILCVTDDTDGARAVIDGYLK